MACLACAPQRVNKQVFAEALATKLPANREPSKECRRNQRITRKLPARGIGQILEANRGGCEGVITRDLGWGICGHGHADHRDASVHVLSRLRVDESVQRINTAVEPVTLMCLRQ